MRKNQLHATLLNNFLSYSLLTNLPMKKTSFLLTAWFCILSAAALFAQEAGKVIELSPDRERVDTRFTVNATVMDNDTWCRVEWPGNYNYDEIAYDDDEADDYFTFSNPGYINVNKFTPWSYPAEVTGGRINVGDGSFPGPFLGTQFRAMIFDDDGPDGLPGTVLDSMDVTVENYNWVEFEGMSAIITSGNFYLGMKQLAPSPDAAPVGVDSDNPTYYKSYSYLPELGWVTSPLQDFMIRAWIANGDNNGNVAYYQVDRFSNFDPLGSPLQGDTTFLGNVTNPYYNDFDWAALPMGWYAYGVKEHYIGGGSSEYNLSNLAGHMTSYTVVINITLCDTTWWEYTVVSINGEEVPVELSPGGSSVILEFNSPFGVHLDISVYCPGNDYYHLNNIFINENKVYNILLSCTMYPARNLVIDPVTLIATWEPPQVNPLKQDFENLPFPPAGWQMQSQGSGWFRTEDGSGGGWNIPGWDSHYACTNDLLTGGNDGSMDYLVTPANKLDYRTDYVMRFHSYFDGFNSQDAYVEYSTDGENWELLYEPDPLTNWEDVELSLSPFSGPDGPPQVWFAFHSDDNGQDGSGWAVDNVSIFSPDPPYTLEGYWVFVDDSLFAVTENTYIDLSPLTYGEDYTIKVKALYLSGLSNAVTDTVFCEYLYPPTCFYFVDSLDGLPFVICPPVDTSGNIPSNLNGFNIYMNSEFIEYFQYTEEWGPPVYYEWNFQPGVYQFSASAVYDLTPFGYPGETGESMSLQTACAVSYGYPLPFLEQWNSGTFESNNWLTDGPNWSINWQEGQPGPSAEFTWDPIQTDYSISLESDQFDAVYITEGRIYLDFDIKLDDFNSDGMEQMIVQVMNSSNQSWTTVITYSNEDGDFDWTSEHINISNLAKGEVFKIRFMAQGENSLHIVSWFIDNIHLYRVCEAPIGLTAECDTNLNTIVLYWTMPGSTDEWIQWDDGINYSAVGMGIPVPFDLAARWEPAQLKEFDSSSITQIAFFPNEESSTYRVRIWSGEQAENLVVDQEVISPEIGEWNTITLETSVPVDITQELWVGYQNDGPNGYQMGVDDGPAIDGYGNMVNYGNGWETLLWINPDLDYNWNIAARLVTETGESILLNKGSKDLMGFNVYRSIDGGPYELIDYISGNTYPDIEGGVIPGALYCYMVTAIYESETDQCESDFSNEACVVCETYVPEEESQVKLNIYPNPASDVLFIEAEEEIESVSIFDSRGETVKRWNGGKVERWNGEKVEIPLIGLAPGLYLVRVETGGVVVGRKVVII